MAFHVKRFISSFRLHSDSFSPGKELLSLAEALKQHKDIWENAVKNAAGGDGILLSTSIGGHLPVMTFDAMLAVALILRGANVHMLLCDKLLPACEHLAWYKTPDLADFVKHGVSRHTCQNCFDPAIEKCRALGIPVHTYSEFLTPAERKMAVEISKSLSFEEIPGFCLDDLRVGEHALAGALRFFARGTLEGEQGGEPVLRYYLQAALLTVYAARNCLNRFNFRSASFHHGIYVPQGLIGEVARQKGVRVANWQVAYRKKSFIFSHHDTYHHTMLTEPVETWTNVPWTPQIEADLMAYLRSRWQGTQDWIWFHDQPQEDLQEIVKETGIDFSRPSVGLLTNVMWDAQLHYPANAFPNMKEWVVQTIQYFSKRPEIQLVIRIHPAELRGTVKSSQLMANEIRKSFPVLPPNVFVIPPESQISTYALMLQCNAAIIYGTKTGVELTSMGIPVIVAGEAWIRNKGLTLDARSVQEYLQILDQLPLPRNTDKSRLEMARKYAYHFFFRRMIPVACVQPTDGASAYKIELQSLIELLPGSDPGLDVICDGILHGSDFVYPAELYAG
ncbi:MAG: capsule biosynthesis protein [Chloroflexota bacterium]